MALKIIFMGTPEFSVPILKSISDYLGRKISIFDYGASWGYYAYQLQSLEFVKEVKQGYNCNILGNFPISVEDLYGTKY